VVVGAQADGGICQTRLSADTWRALDTTLPCSTGPTTSPWTFAEQHSNWSPLVRLEWSSVASLVGRSLPSAQHQPSAHASSGCFRSAAVHHPSRATPTIASLSRFHGPILLVCSAHDPVFPHGTSRAIAEAHHGRSLLLAVPGYAHALALLSGASGRRVESAIERFLVRRLET
jgi:pimeloyl-ACP methyl ester carboxylesterase